jgi:hypothetical protein
MAYKLNAKQLAVVKAALSELDRRWRAGTANAAFGPEAMKMLRGTNSPLPHESEARFVLQMLERPGAGASITNVGLDPEPN